MNKNKIKKANIQKLLKYIEKKENEVFEQKSGNNTAKKSRQ
jgi:hypothetical protein